MNIKDFEEDAKSICRWYFLDGVDPNGMIKPNEETGYRNKLKLWFEARKYQPNELQFFIEIIGKEMNNGEYHTGGFKFSLRRTAQLFADLTPDSFYQNLQPIDSKFVSYPDKMEKAEKWAIQTRFLTTEIKWVTTKSRLGTFLIILQNEGVIKKPYAAIKKEDIDIYFTNRYGLGEKLADSFKWSGKADKHETEFESLKFAIIDR